MNIKQSLDRWSRGIGLDLEYFIPRSLLVSVRYLAMSLAGIFLSIAFARLGGKELYGQYQFVLATIGLLSILSLPGLNVVALKGVVKGVEGVIIGTTKSCFRASFMASLIAIIVGGYYLIGQNQPVIGWSLVTAALLLPFFYGPNGWYAYYEGRLDFRSSTVRIILLNAVTLAVLLFGLWQKWSLPALVGAYFLVNAALTSLYYGEVWRKIAAKKRKEQVDLRDGIFYTLQKFSSSLPEVIQPLVISSIWGYSSLAVFGIAYAFLNAAGGFWSALASTYFPLLLKYQHLSHKRIILQNLALGIALAGAYWLLIEVMFLRLYGTDFTDSFRLATSFTAALLLLPLRYYLLNYFTAKASHNLIITTNTSSYLLALLTFLLIRQVGTLASFVGYIYTMQLVSLLILGVAYYRDVRDERPSQAISDKID